jgi:predicted transcriptional regulator
MSYNSWFQSHGEKHYKIIEKLSHLNNQEVIEYFRFENMVQNEPYFCPLYAKNKKCHDIENLNCYLCACPNFRFNDNGFKKVENRTLFSKCNINSKDGDQFKTDNAIHQNCSGCLVPHHESYIRKNFSRNWFEIMKNVQSSTL